MIKKAVIFDFGGVLVDWNPWYLYKSHFSSKTDFEKFMEESRFHLWNERADWGEKFADLFQEVATFAPQWVNHVRLFPDNFLESIGGPIEGSVEVLGDLSKQGVPLFGLTNWSAETFPLAREKYKFFDLFQSIFVSGVERIAKPDPMIYERALANWKLSPENAIFIDDKEKNIAAAESLGITGVVFKDAQQLRQDLQRLGVLK